ncbi:hypothetical protein GCM10023336_21740 [Streptomyces similanensis]|uniref:Secreted protein n=1 Tax=Streptomyces similanensis TaxID=1274988 RepID=A0ABP9KAJ7_9ACTN
MTWGCPGLFRLVVAARAGGAPACPGPHRSALGPLSGLSGSSPARPGGAPVGPTLLIDPHRGRSGLFRIVAALPRRVGTVTDAVVGRRGPVGAERWPSLVPVLQ